MVEREKNWAKEKFTTDKISPQITMPVSEDFDPMSIWAYQRSSGDQEKIHSFVQIFWSCVSSTHSEGRMLAPSLRCHVCYMTVTSCSICLEFPHEIQHNKIRVLVHIGSLRQLDQPCPSSDCLFMWWNSNGGEKANTLFSSCIEYMFRMNAQHFWSWTT